MAIRNPCGEQHRDLGARGNRHRPGSRHCLLPNGEKRRRSYRRATDATSGSVGARLGNRCRARPDALGNINREGHRPALGCARRNVTRMGNRLFPPPTASDLEARHVADQEPTEGVRLPNPLHESRERFVRKARRADFLLKAAPKDMSCEWLGTSDSRLADALSCQRKRPKGGSC